ncbi:DUF4389 domain-containing protein [bacterium]|nr:MAG: DUF4389 domain-containing protein [bacterium]MCL4231465.1 DUF4389 domain-containing protein [Dehalococcoidia bacterium]
MASAAGAYPVVLDADPAAPQSRLSVFLRIIFAIPQYIVSYFVQLAASVVTFIAWWVILFTGRYPEGMLKFSIGALRWQTRVGAYLVLLTDRYPPFSLEDDPAYPVRVAVDGQVDGRNRLTCFFRILMVIPQIIVLWFVTIAAEVCVLISWFVALFTGSVPEGLHNFIVGWLRWQTRVTSYMYMHVDQYPTFSLN